MSHSQGPSNDASPEPNKILLYQVVKIYWNVDNNINIYVLYTTNSNY